MTTKADSMSPYLAWSTFLLQVQPAWIPTSEVDVNKWRVLIKQQPPQFQSTEFAYTGGLEENLLCTWCWEKPGVLQWGAICSLLCFWIAMRCVYEPVCHGSGGFADISAFWTQMGLLPLIVISWWKMLLKDLSSVVLKTSRPSVSMPLTTSGFG